MAAATPAPTLPDTIMTPPTMPNADSASVARAKRLDMTRQASRGGRASTMLGSSDRLGG
jgi:hypothetical protein